MSHRRRSHRIGSCKAAAAGAGSHHRARTAASSEPPIGRCQTRRARPVRSAETVTAESARPRRCGHAPPSRTQETPAAGVAGHGECTVTQSDDKLAQADTEQLLSASEPRPPRATLQYGDRPSGTD
eukprot:760748-Hanusia_phi.AAC.4